MQDELNEKVIALAIQGTKAGFRVTASVLKAAMRKYLREAEKHKTKVEHRKEAAKAARKAEKATPHGKQTMAQLMKQNQGLTNIEITDRNIKSFERIANKYNIDFALKKDKYSDKPRYIVFFKARNVDVMTTAFKEFSAKELAKAKKPSVKKRLLSFQKKLQAQHKQREKVKQKERGQEL